MLTLSSEAWARAQALGVERRGSVAEGAVRLNPVVVVSRVLDQHLDSTWGVKDLTVQ